MAVKMLLCFAFFIVVLFVSNLETVESSALKFGRNQLREDPEIHMNTVSKLINFDNNSQGSHVQSFFDKIHMQRSLNKFPRK